MKQKKFFIIILIFFLNCTPENNWNMEICSEIDIYNCVDAANTFDSNIKLYVTLESKTLITDKLIIGSIYRMGDDGTYSDYLGTKNFKIEPNTFKIKHSIPFNELGGSGPHLIEFTKEDGTLIISKELIIK